MNIVRKCYSHWRHRGPGNVDFYFLFLFSPGLTEQVMCNVHIDRAKKHLTPVFASVHKVCGKETPNKIIPVPV